MKNDSKISGKKAVPGGVHADESFSKRSFKQGKVNAGRKGSNSEAGPRTSANAGKVGEWTTPSVSDDKAGTRSRANLPPETTAMKAPEAELPKEAQSMAADVLPVPGIHDKLFSVEPYDVARDAKLGKHGS